MSVTVQMCIAVSNLWIRVTNRRRNFTTKSKNAAPRLVHVGSIMFHRSHKNRLQQCACQHEYCQVKFCSPKLHKMLLYYIRDWFIFTASSTSVYFWEFSCNLSVSKYRRDEITKSQVFSVHVIYQQQQCITVRVKYK